MKFALTYGTVKGSNERCGVKEKATGKCSSENDASRSITTVSYGLLKFNFNYFLILGWGKFLT